jgi:nanoRNase/pAp phosphatase (c-di-AMP/oligoRNAs hydrolase)
MDGDNTACALAMSLYLEKLQKKSDLASEIQESKKYLSFLPKSEQVRSSLENLQKFIITLDISKNKPQQVKYATEDGKLKFLIVAKDGSYSSDDIEAYSGGYKYDLIITFGAQDLESLGKIYEQNIDFFYKTPLINIDRSTANEEFGQINLINLISSSNSEILLGLFKEHDPSLIDEDIATCLLSGMIISTKNFKTPNINPQTMEAAAQLMSLGARRDEINQALFRSRTLGSLKLWGRTLARLSAAKDSHLVWSVLNYSDLIKTGADSGELDGIIEELITNIPQAKIIALFYEDIPGKTGKPDSNAIIYSYKNLNTGEILKKFDPKPTIQNMLHIKSSLSMQELTTGTVSALENHLNKIS